VTESGDLQFDRAQFNRAPSPPACVVCKAPLSSVYFQANGKTICEACSYKIREGGMEGSRLGRMLRALGAGAGTALAGAILYWAILAITGYEFGLIAIVVGVAVGKAVRWGSQGRGGWPYQTLAMVLTYLAIVTAYVPLIVKEIAKMPKAEQSQAVQQDGPAAAPAAARPGDNTVVKRAGAGTVVLAVLFLIAFACVAPFLAGLQNILGLIIIGIGLFEAWKINKRTMLVITGPHALAPPGAAATAG
jgi:hypothetical protein